MKKQFTAITIWAVAILFLTVSSGLWSKTNTVKASVENNVMPKTYTVNASAKTVPSGTRVSFSIGGKDCPCTGAEVATAGRSGEATANFTITCDPDITRACVINALGAYDGKNYKGSKKPTLSGTGIYLADITMKAY